MLNNQKPTTPLLIKDLGMLYTSDTKKYKHKFGIFECQYCKNTFKAQTTHINQNNIKSCGCIVGLNNGMRKHNKANKTRLYTIWKNMRQRCNNSKNISYKNYGGRGICITKEWSDFKRFEEWSLENGYEEHLTIDRINNNGNYEPLNCRWSTREVQARNTRILMSTNTSGYRGVTFCKRDMYFISRITVNRKKILLGYFKTAIEAAKKYDEYIILNNLQHTINGVN